jgi:RimJ/RimL family protein N-acetyltransferase
MNPNEPLLGLGVLQSQRVALVPIHEVDRDEMVDLMFRAREVFRFYGQRAEHPMPPRTREDACRVIDHVRRANGHMQARYFATRDLTSGAWVGGTALVNVDLFQRRVELGWTWLHPSAQRTHVNTEAKLLGLRAAFERLGCMRVELRTDVRNEASRNAILRLGAREEGVLRSHSWAADGSRRDTACFSITVEEWPEVRARLLRRMGVVATSSRLP